MELKAHGAKNDYRITSILCLGRLYLVDCLDLKQQLSTVVKFYLTVNSEWSIELLLWDLLRCKKCPSKNVNQHKSWTCVYSTDVERCIRLWSCVWSLLVKMELVKGLWMEWRRHLYDVPPHAKGDTEPPLRTQRGLNSAVPWKAEKHDVCEFKYVAKCVAVNCNMWLVTQKAIRTLVFMS